jgi:hypothetical protein
MPTYSPTTEADTIHSRPYTRLSNDEISARIASGFGHIKPWVYMDCIDSISNIRPDIKLVVGDGRSTESIRQEMSNHHLATEAKHDIMFYPDKMSQWVIFNDIIKTYCTEETKYFVYSSSDVIWTMDWIAEAIKEFDKDPKLQIIFPCVNRGDPNLPCQIASGPRDLDLINPPYQDVARARVLNAYAMIFRMDFLRTYDGYPTIFRNCFSESFLAYMCEAVGGEMKLMPRGWVHHYGEGDKWTTHGSAYYYTEEKMTFQSIMNFVLMHKAMKAMDVKFLKKALYKQVES